MNKLFILGLVSLGACSHTHYSVRGYEDQRKDSVALKVHCPNMDQHEFLGGTGVVISKHHVLTAAHVVPCLDAEVYVHQYGWDHDRVLTMKVERIAQDADVARLVITDGGTFETSPISVALVGEKDWVCTVTVVPVADRRCGFVDYVDDWTVNSSVIVEPGNSGSALYDFKGHLVGIMTGQRNTYYKLVVGGVATAVGSLDWVLR